MFWANQLEPGLGLPDTPLATVGSPTLSISLLPSSSSASPSFSIYSSGELILIVLF